MVVPEFTGSSMSDSADTDLVDEFRQAMHALEELYRASGNECAVYHPELCSDLPGEFINRMLDLHRGLLLKIYGGLFPLDWRNSPTEYAMARELFHHVWQRDLDDARVKQALEHLIEEQSSLQWDALVGPFVRLGPLRSRVGRLQTLVMRTANLIAKASGRVNSKEARHLEWIQAELRRQLEPVALDPGEKSGLRRGSSRQAVLRTVAEASDIRADFELNQVPEIGVAPRPCEELLAEALAELDALIGLDAIKQDVRGLVNFLKMQQQRQQFGLPHTPISLHAVFRGNPGTGKTTVARLLGKIFGALGILRRGHLIETDRSGLVAEFAGQTGPRTNKKIDDALDGVLFIDEAYSLVAEKGDDPYGAEAVQTLLKRMEDDRDRLVIVLAGYTKPIDRLLRSNPGFTSRFSRHFTFPDYTAAELGQIFGAMAGTNQYELPVLTRVKLLLGFRHLLDGRDEHFGNGRLVRNAFEAAIGRLANRIAEVAPITRELLTTLEAGDIALDRVPSSVWKDLDSAERRFRFTCPGCRNTATVPQTFLGRMLQCKRCQESFRADWGEIAVDES